MPPNSWRNTVSQRHSSSAIKDLVKTPKIITLLTTIILYHLLPLLLLIIWLCILLLSLRPTMLHLNSPWSYPTILTPTPFNTWMTRTLPTTIHNMPMPAHCRPIPHIQISHHLVFSITHQAVAPPLPTLRTPLPNQRPPRKWKLRVHIALSF
jgi:hypothetical protein